MHAFTDADYCNIITETKCKYDREISISRVYVSFSNGSDENKIVIKGKTL